MSSRTSSLALLSLATTLAVAGCSSSADIPEVAEGDEHIECAVAGATDFAEACAVDRVSRDGALSLVVRHPDGAFRRFDVVRDGRGVTVADGADPAQTQLADGKLEVAVGEDRYRFPATMRSNEQE
ncbi:hypothetical protein GCM10011371_09150 [Novosphingobium marinum]|uniref:Lipoprotein n=1 Tax=Novosphingobium marinum TaxID=1514948 RepID=A0A7Y9XU24_9SPHN|nr:hypothetical protein [Novosphingobium marinum]NYH94604.1 hypothetical protein [Novosphingobium marinum]GGC23624.1 hypothetical protein GCM10011371_09150 [Novosphingobium marinum]